MCDEKIVFLPRTNPQEVPSGWVKIVNHCDDGNCKILPHATSNIAKKLDQELEEFYMTSKSGQQLAKDKCDLGQSVAVLFTDTRFYRGTVVGLYGEDVVKVYFVDQGWTALVKTSFIFWLDKKFWNTPELVVDIKLSSNQIEEGLGWLENMKDNARVYQTVEEMSKHVSFSGSCIKKRYKMDQVLKSIVMKKILMKMC